MVVEPASRRRPVIEMAGPAFALLGWIALVCALTWPLAQWLGTNLPLQGGCDARYSMWALAWQTHALSGDLRHYFDANIYHPVPQALAYGPTAMGALPLFGPVFAVTGNPVLAANVLFLGGCALTAWTIGLTVRRWTASAAAGAVAGAAFLATPWVIDEWIPSCPHYAMLMWLPLILDRAARPQLRGRDAALLAAMMALQGAVEIVYIAPAVVVPVALVAAFRLRDASTRRTGMWLVTALAASVAIWSPVVLEYAVVRRANSNLAMQTPWHPDTEFGGPKQKPVLPWSLFGRWRDARAVPPTPTAVPFVAFGMIGLGALCRRREDRGTQAVRSPWRHAALWAAVGALLSLPPRVVVAGHQIGLPHALLYEHLPSVRVLRVSARLGVASLIGLSCLTGLAFAAMVQRVTAGSTGRRADITGAVAAAAAAAALILQPRWGIAYPPGYVWIRLPVGIPFAMPRLDPYAQILSRGKEPLLVVHQGLFGTAIHRVQGDAFAMAASIGGWSPLLNGYSSYYPHQYERSIWLATRLPDDLGALNALREETGVGLILVWPKGLPAKVRDAWQALADTGGNPALELIGSGEQDALLFRVTGVETISR